MAVKFGYIRSKLGTILGVTPFYPVGYIIEETTGINPEKWYGGTWELYGEGKFTVCIDKNDIDFDESGKTGGSKSNTHNHYTLYSNDGNVFYMATSTNVPRSRVVTTGRAGMNVSNATSPTRQDSTYDETINITPPYITIYRWVKTAY